MVKPDRPPDLQKLVQRFSGYWSIPPDVWQQYQEAVRRWEKSLRAGDHYHRAALSKLESRGGSDK